MSNTAASGDFPKDDFVERLCTEARESAAVQHPYLDALRTGNLPDMNAALQDFAFQYGLYSARFSSYVEAVINKLQDPAHRAVLEENLAEEQGDLHDVSLPADVLAGVVGKPHSELYQRFSEAVGVRDHEATPQCPGQRWSDAFLALCEEDECTGAGAIGIGTEFIVSRIYQQILDGLDAHADLTPAQRVFFDLHSECDDKHAADMLEVTTALAHDAAARESITRGVRKALELRAGFWDELLRRAHGKKAAESASAGH